MRDNKAREGKTRGKSVVRKRRIDRTPKAARLMLLPMIALALTLVVEWCNRWLSIDMVNLFMLSRPHYFLYNALIILTTLSVSELFRRRRAVLATVSLIWLVLGLVQFLVVKYRTQPFCSVDILMLKDAFSLINIYFTWPQIIAMFGGGALVLAFAVWLFLKLPKREKFSRWRPLALFLGLVVLSVGLVSWGTRMELFPTRFESLVDAYHDYGFAACFTFTFGQRGISRPSDYSGETVAEVLKNIDEEPDAESDAIVYPTFGEDDNLAHPNIVFVQLESFFDVNTIIGGEYSADPTPCFNRLSEKWPSGLLYVPTIGGGTANTEFEMLTGLNLDFFGAGEYPYNTILQEKACESICYDLKDYGYTATAMHNNSGSFYSRNIVYPRLGFDRFVSLEYMKDAHYTSIGWCKDEILTNEIVKALESSAARDIVFCIAVETHGKYADVYEPKEGDIEVLSLPEGIPLAPFQNFINTLPNTDAFLEALLRALVRYDEPTIVVAYGDHLPALELENDMLSTGSVYASRYVIWNNFGGKFEAPDLQAYRLGANLIRQLGFSGGAITKLHQSVDATEMGEEYLSRLELLEYDMLYGDQHSFEGEYPYEPTEMVMGSVPIEIEKADFNYHRLLVTGKNLTEYSKIVLNGQTVQTVYVDSQHIVAPMDALPTDETGAPVREFCVAQVTKDGIELSRTELFEIP